MATSITVANFQAALGEVYDALTGDDFASARRWLGKAEAQHVGLEMSASDSGASLSRRTGLDALAHRIEESEAAISRANGRGRLIRTRVGPTS